MQRLKLTILSAVAMAVLFLNLVTTARAGLVSDPYALTNLPSVILPTMASNLTTTPIRINHGSSLTVFIRALGSNSGTGTLTAGWALDQDSTNAATTATGGASYALGGATPIRTGVVIPPTSLGGYSWRLLWLSNGCSQHLYLTNITVVRPR